jgi:hypothetical protein
MLEALSVSGALAFTVGVCFKVLRFWVCVLGRLVLRGCAIPKWVTLRKVAAESGAPFHLDFLGAHESLDFIG